MHFLWLCCVVVSLVTVCFVSFAEIKRWRLFFSVLFDCVLVSVPLWWGREIEFQSVWLITVSIWGERFGVQRGIPGAGKLLVCSGDLLSARDSSPTPNIRFVSSYFHSFAAGRLFCGTWTSLPFPRLSCTFVGFPSACVCYTVVLSDPLGPWHTKLANVSVCRSGPLCDSSADSVCWIRVLAVGKRDPSGVRFSSNDITRCLKVP